MVMFRVQYCGVNDGFWIQERSRHFFSDPRPRWGRYVLAPRDPGDPEPGASAPDLRLRDPRSGRFASPSRQAHGGWRARRWQRSTSAGGPMHPGSPPPLSGAALRWDCLQEAQLRAVIFLPEMATFGNKTDTTLCGQAVVLPSSEASNSGLHTLQEGTRAGLLRWLAALPPDTLQQLADRFRASR